MNSFFAMGFGIGTKNSKDNWLDVYYPSPIYNLPEKLIQCIQSIVGYTGGNQVIEIDNTTCHALESQFMQLHLTNQAAILNALETSELPKLLTILETDSDIDNTPTAFLKLHMLSHRLIRPHGLNLNNLFQSLQNVAWTNDGAVDLEELHTRQLIARTQGKIINVLSVDKFPKMSNYIVPTGVRIAETARVRLGAYIGSGTTIMHEGFVNFNAGTEGRAMIEGRISAGVLVGEDSDLGGSSSTMGTLSGGNNIVISIGKNCLIGANAGTGIPLGNQCTIEAGLYVTSASKVTMLDDDHEPIDCVKASSLANKDNLLFRRNSVTGSIECLNNVTAIELNKTLHIND